MSLVSFEPSLICLLNCGQVIPKQGSLHYTPEHCLVNDGFPLFWWKKHVSNGQHVSFKEPCKSSIDPHAASEPKETHEETVGELASQATKRVCSQRHPVLFKTCLDYK